MPNSYALNYELDHTRQPFRIDSEVDTGIIYEIKLGRLYIKSNAGKAPSLSFDDIEPIIHEIRDIRDIYQESRARIERARKYAAIRQELEGKQ